MNNKDISIKIYNAKPLSFIVNSDSDFGGDLKSEKFNLELLSEIGIDKEKSSVSIKIDLDVVLRSNKESLFRIKSFFEFGVTNLVDVLIESENGLILDSGFARKLLNISIGGTRGMLSVYLSSTHYKDFTLPIANIPDNFFPKKGSKK